MLRQCVELCPDELWTATFPCPQDPDRNIVRTTWRIAFHAAYFTHLYLGQNEAAFQPPPAGSAVRREDFKGMWQPPWDVEPYELPEDVGLCRQQEILEYIDFVDTLIDPTVDALDLDSPESGFSRYEGISKLSHELMNLRHIQGHVGQLSELLMARDIDIDWVSKAASYV